VETLDAVETRVLGCLLEKQQSTPDAYPLTLNALRAACNQATSRDPVVDYDEGTVRDAAQRLGRHGLSRLTNYHGSRTAKYRHLVDDTLALSPGGKAVLTVLMLRGPQTLGELKQRTERLHRFEDLAAVEQALDELSVRELGRWRERRPGQKEARYEHLLEDSDAPAAEAPAPTQAPPPPAAEPESEAPPQAGIADELASLRRDLEALRAEVAALREQLGG
jgi:uncharacterized protein